MAYTTPKTWGTSEVVTAAALNTHIRDNLNAGFPVDPDASESWLPTLQGVGSNPDATVTGRKWRIGPIQFVWARFEMASISTGSGAYFVTLPVAASGITAMGASGGGQSVGAWQSLDASTSANNAGGTVTLRASTEILFSLPTGGAVSSTVPFTWSTTDILSFEAMYPVA